MSSDECLDENPNGFPTQRAALKGESQLRWAGGFSSRASLLLLLCDSLVRVLRVILLAVCMRDGVFVAGLSSGLLLCDLLCNLGRVFSCENCLLERWEGDF